MPLISYFRVFALSCLGLLGLVSIPHAEDPLLGVVRALKCVNCVPDSVVFLVDDPIDGQQIEVKIPTREFNKILTSLQGKRLFNKPDSGCFYWQEKLKAPKADKVTEKAATKDTLKAAGAQASTNAENLYKTSVCVPYSAEFKGVN
jgi:hypothetical protein